MLEALDTLQPGQRIQVHPDTGWWQHGMRYGEVASVPKRGKHKGEVLVRLDRAASPVYLPPELILA